MSLNIKSLKQKLIGKRIGESFVISYIYADLGAYTLSGKETLCFAVVDQYASFEHVFVDIESINDVVLSKGDIEIETVSPKINVCKAVEIGKSVLSEV